jgi:sporulation protein YlmC with PRC-barrel domain
MQVLGSALTKLKIISLQTGYPVATSGNLVINPDKLEVMAIHADQPGRQNLVVLPQDIRQIGRDAILVDSEDELGEAEAIVRLQDVLKQGFKLTGIPVVNESAQRLGRVADFSLNLDDFKVQKLYVKQSLLKNFLTKELVINRIQITDVTPQQITVRDATVKKPLLAPVAPATLD